MHPSGTIQDVRVDGEKTGCRTANRAHKPRRQQLREITQEIRWRKKRDGGEKMDQTAPLISQHSTPSHLSSTCLFTPTCWYHHWCLPHPPSLSDPPTSSKTGKMEDERREDGRNTRLSWYNYSISISSHPSFLSLHSSFSPSQLSLTLSPAPSLPPLYGCLFRLGRDKWERMNTLGAWGSRRAECEGQGEERGGGGVTWTRCDWPVRKIKPRRWWHVMNGGHYEWFAKRRAGWDIWMK